jgi:hypothetical protein
MRFFKHYQWWLPICMYSSDANAWGLMTHLYFAHSLLWAMPLLDPRMQRAIKKFPDVVMAGACIPDLAVVSQHFSKTHQWRYAHQFLAAAKSDEEMALAIGFASHLYVDVIAHNHFVPAHEASWFQQAPFKPSRQQNGLLTKAFKKHFKFSKWLNHSAITHITSEWAMDAYLTPLVATTPSKLLNAHQTLIAQFITPHFDCDENVTIKAIQQLSFWDRILRTVKLPHCIYGLARIFDPSVVKHFIYYIAKTQTAMKDFGQTLNGVNPSYGPELNHLDAQQLFEWRKDCLAHLHLMHSRPIRYFTKNPT